MLSLIDRLVNSITMYRVILYYVLGLVIVGLIESALGMLSFSAMDFAVSTAILVFICAVTNYIFAKVFAVPANVESVYITAFILTLIITPPTAFDPNGFMFLLWVSVLAMASKYIVSIDKKHLFNPAALAVAITAATMGQAASWWIGTISMLPFVVIGGILMIRKIHRFDLVISFMVFASATSILLLISKTSPLLTVERIFSGTSLVFFAAVMLTEPLTTPPTRALRIAYGALVGILFTPGMSIGSLHFTPELALLAGNIFSYLVSPKGKRILTLINKTETANGTWHFFFKPNKPFSFKPGQYVEWTLGYPHPDTRGNRRYFTLASSPTENAVQLGVRCYPKCSSYKQALINLKPGETIITSQLSGDFTLPTNTKQKLAFIAGGIGITPFRSMMKYLSDTGEKRDVTLFYSNKTEGEIAYREVFDESEKKIGAKVVYNLSDTANIPAHWKGEHGSLTGEMIARHCPDYKERMFYISGPNGMVVAFKKTLAAMGVPHSHIRVDFFPGF